MEDCREDLEGEAAREDAREEATIAFAIESIVTWVSREWVDADVIRRFSANSARKEGLKSEAETKESSEEASSSLSASLGVVLGFVLVGIDIGFEVDIRGFGPAGGGFLASDSSESLCICAKVSFGGPPDDVVGLADRGEGDWALLRSEGLFAAVVRNVPDVADLFTLARLASVGEAFCSNLPINEVVGGIGVVSNA